MGANGLNGADGTDGADGADGTDGTDGKPSGGGLPLVLQLPGDNFFPEGIALADNGDVYVGSVATGTIIKATAAAVLRARPFSTTAPGTGAVGMLVDKDANTLWTCQSELVDFAATAVVGFDLSSGALKATHTFPAATSGVFCNDLAIDDLTNDLYATDSLAGRVVRVASADRLINKPAEEWITDTTLAGPSMTSPFGANGIFKLGSFVYVVNLGRGTLLRIAINGDGTAGAITPVALKDKNNQAVTLDGADGLKKATATALNSLLVVENSAGRLSHIVLGDVGGTSPTGVVSTLTTRLDAPTTVAVSDIDESAYIVEGQLDHLFQPTVAGPPELPFGVVRLDLFLDDVGLP